MERTTYHLYHHQPDPLPPTEVGKDRAWHLNNATAYSLVAMIAAPDETTALQAAQASAQQRRLPRGVHLQAGNLLRETLPGDVLVAEYAAWMLDATGQLRPISYRSSPPWKSLRQRVGQQATVDTLAWSPDCTVLAASASDRRVVLHVLADDEPYRRGYERGENSHITALAWSPHGNRLAAAHANGDVHLFTPAPWHTDGFIGSILVCRTEETTPSYSRPTPRCLAWSLDGIQVFAGRDDGVIVGWDSRTGACLPQEQRHAKVISALAFSPRSEHLLLTASADCTVRIRDRTTSQEVIYAHRARVMAACWSPDGTLIASCDHVDPAIHLWHPRTAALRQRIPLSITSTGGLEIATLAWSPDGRLLAAGSNDSTIQLVDVARGQHVHTYRIDAFRRVPVQALAWSPDGSLLAAGNGSVGIDLWQASRDVREARETQQERNVSPC